jgi:uncharacterized membrane protein YgcG
MTAMLLRPFAKSLAVLPLALLAASNVACADTWRDAEAPREDYYTGSEAPPPGVSTATAPGPTATSLGAVDMPAEESAPAPATAPEAAEDTDPAAAATFEPALAPYGSWVDVPTYGHVWSPDPTVVGSDFSPYLTAGHWSYTDEGYYWASDYSWGWAPFHYGRWAYVAGNGWVWIPGARYAPAWVEWRYGGGYIGWGPMSPGWGWYGGRAVACGVGPTPWVFAPGGSFFSPNPARVVAPPAKTAGLIAGSSPYTPPARTLTGAHPFIGPSPSSAGIPESHVAAARAAVPAAVRPGAVAWRPATGSAIAPARAAVAASPRIGPPSIRPVAASPTYRPTPTYYPPTTYRPPSTYRAPSTTYYPPSATRPPTSYAPPSSYRPPTTYSPPPTTYHPPTTYKPSTPAPSGGGRPSGGRPSGGGGSHGGGGRGGGHR